MDRTTAAWTMGIGLGLALSLGLGSGSLEVATHSELEQALARTATSTKCPPQAAIDGSDVLMTLQTRDHEVTVYSSSAGPRFTVAIAGSGAVLAQQLDSEAFAASFPGLHEHLQRALADDVPGQVWAGP